MSVPVPAEAHICGIGPKSLSSSGQRQPSVQHHNVRASRAEGSETRLSLTHASGESHL